jgi:hypothetical protein
MVLRLETLQLCQVLCLMLDAVLAGDCMPTLHGR